MKIICSSDWHLDAITSGVRRFSELEDAVRTIVDKAIASKVDVFLFLGDLCDPDSGSSTFRCVEIALRAAMQLTKAGISSYWMAGNHDVIEDGTSNTTLSPLRAIRRSHHDGDGSIVNMIVVEQPMSMLLDMRHDRANFVFLPFVSTAFAYDPVEVVSKLIACCPHEYPIVVAGHLNIEGMIPGEESGEMARGRGVRFPYEAIVEASAKIRVAKPLLLHGHYHRRQAFRPAGVAATDPLIHIPGSLARLTFGEEDHQPGYLLMEV